MGQKVLILTPFYPPNIGGAETFALEFAKEICKSYDVTLLTYQPFQGKAISREHLKMQNGSLTVCRMNWWLRPSGAWRLESLKNLLSVAPKMALISFFICLTNRFKIVHAHGLICGGIAVILKKVFRFKVFLTLLAIYDFKNKPSWFNLSARIIFKNCDAVFVEGQGGKENITGLCPLKKIRVFNHWVDQEIFKPAPRAGKAVFLADGGILFQRDKIRVLFIGRKIPEKGRHIVEEIQKILWDKERYQFFYVENAPYEDLPKYYQMAHVVIVPSLYAEGFARVVAEAASCGCAVVTSDRGSLPEMVKDFGFVEIPESKQMAFRIANIDYDSVSKFTAKIAKQKFSPKNAEVFLNEH